MILFAAIDGTVVAKVIKLKIDGKIVPKVIIPDLLNVLFDPTDTDLKSGLLERHIIAIDVFKRQAKEKKWKNTETIKGIKGQNRDIPTVSAGNEVQSDVPFVTIWERYGKITKDKLLVFNNFEHNPTDQEMDTLMEDDSILHLESGSKAKY